MKKVITISLITIFILYGILMLWNIPNIKNDTSMFEKGMNTYKFLIEDINYNSEEIEKVDSEGKSIIISFVDGTIYSINYDYKGLDVTSNQEFKIPLNLKWSFIQLNVERLVDFSTGDLEISWDRLFNQLDVTNKHGEYTEIYRNYEIKMKKEKDFLRVFIKKIE